jgi:hypothetical protein
MTGALRAVGCRTAHGGSNNSTRETPNDELQDACCRIFDVDRSDVLGVCAVHGLRTLSGSRCPEQRRAVARRQVGSYAAGRRSRLDCEHCEFSKQCEQCARRSPGPAPTAIRQSREVRTSGARRVGLGVTALHRAAVACPDRRSGRQHRSPCLARLQMIHALSPPNRRDANVASFARG